MIRFGVHAPSKDAFWQSWIDAGIVTEPGVYTPAYSDFIRVGDNWHGLVVKTPATFDGGGNELTPAVVVPDWHTNVLVGGALEQQFTHGLAQTDGAGTPLPLFQRTHAASVFGLTEQPHDPATNFPASWQSQDGISYCDATQFSSPSNVIL